MIIVLGTATPLPENLPRAMAISQAHVLRSRGEPGCLSHSVGTAADAPGSLLFVERWSTMADLQQHFAVPESRSFAKELSGLCRERPGMTVYEANEVSPGR